MIYFVQPIDGGPIKIGCSENVPFRIKQLETHYDRRLALLATIEGDRKVEAEVHARFAHLRLGRTEQFRPGPELVAFIGRPLLVGINPEAVEAIKPSGKGQKPLVIGLRGSAEYKAWLVALAEHEGMTVSQLCLYVVRKYARQIGFRDPPKR